MNASLRQAPSFLASEIYYPDTRFLTGVRTSEPNLKLYLHVQQRLLMSVFDACGFTFIEYMLNKIQRRVHQNTFLHDEFRRKTLRCLSVIKAALPLIIHFHLVVFYWHGTFYDIAKRITGIRYVSDSINADIFQKLLLEDFSLFSFLIFFADTHKTLAIERSSTVRVQGTGCHFDVSFVHISLTLGVQVVENARYD